MPHWWTPELIADYINAIEVWVDRTDYVLEIEQEDDPENMPRLRHALTRLDDLVAALRTLQ
jgi:hypothetical protein